MGRLYRPHIPFDTRCRVALRQLGDMWPEDLMDAHRSAGGSWLKLLDQLLARLADLLNCGVGDLRLDHDPALGTRPRRGEGKNTIYMPPANDPDHLLYRPHGPQFAGSHLIKTNIRGDNGQYPDRVLIKRERKRTSKTAAKVGHPKRKWASAPLLSANRWPPKGSRKFR